MLESLVANLLNRFLGMYVQNFDPKQLNVGIWSGDVTLRNLELRREALDQLKLPLNVVEGHLGLLTLSIPWSNLRGKPVKINIEDVFLLAAPREDADVDPEEEERRTHAVKMEKLDSAELLKERNTEGMSQEEQKKNQTFTASLVTAIVDNVQVTVKNIHIRYEDSISDPGHPFALGITLEGFDAVSTDDEWRPTFIQSTSSTTHKLASLKSLAVYWDTDAKLLGSGKGSQKGIEHAEFLEKFKALAIRDEDGKVNNAHQFILKPVSGRAGLEMDKTGKTDRPKVKAKLLFDELGFIIDDNQYRDALMLVDLFHYFIRHQEYKKYQPKSKPKEDPQAWLRFAGQAVLDKIHDRNKRWSWAYFKERRDDRIRYIELFKKKKKEEKLTPDESTDLDKLERKLTYEDLRFWRSLARNQLRKENAGVAKPPPKKTWTQWAWGSKPEEETHDDAQMTEQQRNELYSAINFDEKQSIAEAVEMPKEYVKMQVDLSLRTGSFMLRRDPHGKKTEILKLMFDSFKTQFLQRPSSFVAKVSLEGMRLYDGTTEGNLFPQIITIKDAPQVPDDERFKELGDNEDEEATEEGMGEEGAKEAMEESEDENEDSFFRLEFENNPLDGSADTALTMKLKGMEIIYNPAFVVEVVRFFKPPERHMESIGALMESAGQAVEGIRNQTRAGLEFALEEHKTINAKLDLQAPLIIVPDSVTKKSTICLIVDAGHASVNSELVDKATLHDIQSKQRQKLSEEDFKRLEGLMYDKFILKLDSTQVLIGTTIEETRSKLHAKDSNFHVVDKINVDFMIETCIVPKGTELTKFRVSGHLPVLHASISDQKYKSLMKIIDFAIPKFGDDDGDEKKKAAAPAQAGSLVPTTSKDDDRRGSFTFAAQRHEIVMEEESVHGGDDETFQDAKEGKKSEVPINQKNFELKFTVDKLQGSLYRADSEGKQPDKLLVDLVAENFSLNFYQRPFDMSAEVRLRTLAVEDHVEDNPLPEFKNILESEKVEGQDLFQLKFVKVNKDSPEFMSKYEGIATNLDVQVSTINVIVTRKTLLTLLDFVLITFTNQDAPEQQQTITESDTTAEPAAPQPVDPNADKIRVRADLKRIAVVLNNDGIRLATLGLNTAKVSVFLMGKTMRIGAHLGDLQLIDDVNQGVSEESNLRRLVTIQGDELAHFSYETYDSESEAYPGYDASIYLRAGSLKVNFVTEPFRKIMDFGVKFGKMQAIFNAARQAAASQANQLQQKASKMHFDVLVRTPIVVFPRMVITDEPERDTLTAELGEIYANNTFVPLDDSKDADMGNKISAGIRNVRLLTFLHYDDNRSEELQMIEKLDLDFKINMVEHRNGSKRPDMEMEGSLSDLNLKITQEQMRFALELSKSIPAAFASEPDDEIQDQIEEELPDSTVQPAKEVTATDGTNDEKRPTTSSTLGPELGTSEDTWTKLDLVFKVGAIGLELVKGVEHEPIGDVKAHSLSQFALNNTHVKLRMLSDGALESELLIQSLTIRDTRTKDQNKFRKIMSLINTDVKQQFMASVSISGGVEKNMVALLTIDSPRMIFSLDYVFALKSWVDGGLATEGPLEIEEQAEDSDETKSVSTQHSATGAMTRRKSGQPDVVEEKAPEAGMGVNFRVNVVDAQIVLIANPAITTSEAIVLGTKQVLVAKQHAMTLQVEKVGMFLCRMDRFESNRLRILDDFSVQTSLDLRNQGKDSTLTSINVDIEPLVLRLSLRDILLAMQIVNRASAMSSDEDKKLPTEEPKKITPGKGTSVATASRRKSSVKPGSTTAATRSGSIAQPSKSLQVPHGQSSMVMTREEMKVALGGIRVVLIGDKHELPMLDWSVSKFAVDVRDWSSNLSADTRIDTFINVYSFSKSAWEPLIEPWSLGFHMSKDTNPDKLAVEFYSKKSLELTATTATIALASKSFDFLSGDEDILNKPRGMDAPYRIRNYTGFDINVWAESKTDDEGSAAKMEDGQEIPWRFEDALTTRETLSSDGASGVVGVKLEGSGFNSVDKIVVSREGETVYNLYPKKDKIQHRLLVEVKLGTDNIKYIIFRSPLLVENNTQIPVELGVFSPEEGTILKIEKIAPGESRPAPVGAAFMHSLIVRPDQGFGYTWCRERLFWRDLLKRSTRTLTCRGENEGEDSPPFYFQMHASFDEKNPLTRSYPYMRIKLHAPVEVQNLLPFDFKYRIFDHNTKKDWTNFLRNGGVSPVHVVELTHLLMLSVDMQDTPFKASEFTVINSSDRENFKRERTLVVKDRNDLNLRLKLHYFNIPDSGGAFKVTIYSPYILLNRTGLELEVRSKQFLGATKAAAGQGNLFVGNEGDEPQKPQPMMFNFSTDDKKNRALLKIGDSQWSKPQSFDAIGSTYSVTLPSASGRKEMDIGVSVEEGEGKYNLTKIVTIAPRYIVKNKLGEDINLREPGSSDILTLKNGELLPLRMLRQSTSHQLSLCYPGVNNAWSSPFDIANVGNVHVKLAKAKQRQKLVRIDVLMEHATIFLHLSVETKHWPFSMRNESNQEFLFWQANPNTDDDDEDQVAGWKPVRYRLPPRSIMPYAWDFPAARRKEIVMSANKKEKAVKLAEIGNPPPMRIPPSQNYPRGQIIDLNIIADGPTQTLVLTNFKQSKSLYKQKSAAATSSTQSGFEVKEMDTDVTFSARLAFAGIGISLVNRHLKELVYLTLRDIELKYTESPLYQTVKATIKWIQIDNQLYGGIFPIIFYPSVVPKTGKEMEAHPILHAAVTRVKDDSYGVLYIKYFTILLQQMTLEIDEDFIFALLDFVKIQGASWSEVKEGTLCETSLEIPEPTQEESGQDIYFEFLHLQPMQFDISFVRTERINAEEEATTTAGGNPLMFFVNVVTMSIGNVNDAPIRFNALMLENARVSVASLVQNVKTHYVQESLRQVHIVLGSADFLGNPVGLFNNLSSGVQDIFYEPYQGLVMTDRPQDLGIGIAKGAGSFVKKSIFGFSDSAAKFTAAMGKGLSAATMDKEFQDRRRMSRARNRPKHALYGITSGGNAFAESLASGIGGLARHPMQGAEKEGAFGFAKGVAKGVIGLATKPAIGAFDLASNMAEGVRNTTTVFDQEGLDRVRLTRFIGTDGIVRPYSQREALGQFWLKTVDSGKYFHEDYIAHLELSGHDLMVMLTYNNILLIKTKKLASEWDVPLRDVQTISKERTGIAISLKGGVSGPFLPVGEEGSRNWLYKMIAVAVNSFNERYGGVN